MNFSINKFATYSIARLQEKSTWYGFISFITAMGLMIEPDLKEAIVSAGIALAGLIGIFTADKKTNKDS